MMARTAWVHLCIIQLPSWLWASALMTSEVLRLVTDDASALLDFGVGQPWVACRDHLNPK